MTSLGDDGQGHEFQQGLLRCESCQTVIGQWSGEPPDLGSGRIIVRCYGCAAIEEAEAILREAAQ